MPGQLPSDDASDARRPGQRDHSAARLTRHALDRFLERFWTGAADDRGGAEQALRQALRRTRRLGRNPANQAVALLAVHAERVLVAILQDEACTTVLTWPQFAPRMAEFGRAHLPRKRGRMLRRLGWSGGDRRASEKRPGGAERSDELWEESPSDWASLEETE